jgi:uncharacterized protein (DUF1697 family)
MRTYIALLRGINGFTDVKTFIQRGNVVVLSARELASVVAAAPRVLIARATKSRLTQKLLVMAESR